ncbi:MAG: PAS domain-containing protein [Chromatiales bacterium]|nr:PAS domain-containing protein [Chromatiales bacterium]
MVDGLLKEAPTLLAVVDRDLICRNLSHGWLTRLGVTRTGKRLSLSLAELFLLDEMPEFEDRLKQVLRGDEPLQDVPVCLLGGEMVTEGFLSAWLIHAETGVGSLFLAATCSTHLNQALEELRQLRTMHELILNAAGEGIYGLDANGLGTFGNAATTEILGWQPGDVIGKRSHDIHHHSDHVLHTCGVSYWLANHPREFQQLRWAAGICDEAQPATSILVQTVCTIVLRVAR